MQKPEVGAQHLAARVCDALFRSEEPLPREKSWPHVRGPRRDLGERKAKSLPKHRNRFLFQSFAHFSRVLHVVHREREPRRELRFQSGSVGFDRPRDGVCAGSVERRSVEDGHGKREGSEHDRRAVPLTREHGADRERRAARGMRQHDLGTRRSGPRLSGLQRRVVA